MRLPTLSVLVIPVVSLAAWVHVAWANPQFFAEAKKAGLPAKNCQYCHTEALPKKDSFKPETLNARGKFLLTDMQQRKLKAPDLGKLKEFPGGTEQK